MNRTSKVRVALLAVVVTLLSGCATGGVKRLGDYASYKYQGQKIGSVSVSFSGAVKEKLLKEGTNYDPASLAQSITEALQGKNLFDTGATNKLEVALTEVQVISGLRSSLGMLSMGDERLVGTVSVKAENGSPFLLFEVSVSYGGGGLMHLQMLNGQFAQLTAQGVLGEEHAAATGGKE